MDRDLFASPRFPTIRESYLSRRQSNRLRDKEINLISAQFCVANVDMADAIEVEGQGNVVPLAFRFLCPNTLDDGQSITITWGDSSSEEATFDDHIIEVTHYYRSSGMFPIRIRGLFEIISTIQMNISGETPAVVRFDLGGLTRLPVLQVLHINGVRTVVSGGMKALAEVNSGDGIVSLYLSGIRSFLGTTLKGVGQITELSYLDCSDSNIRGNISELTGLEELLSVNLANTQVTGNLSALSGTESTGLLQLDITNTAVEGDVAALAAYIAMTQLWMEGTAVEGDADDLAALTAMQFFSAHDCPAFVGSAEVMTAGMAEMLLLDLGGSQVTGDLAAIVAATPLNTYLDISGTLIAGDVADLNAFLAADGYRGILDGCAVDTYTDGGDWSGHGGWDMSLQDLGLTEAMVDDILEDMAGTLAAHAEGTLTLDTGSYQDMDYVVINDGQGIEETFQFDQGQQAVGAVQLNDEPVDGDTLTVSDGVEGHDPLVFEFDDNAAVEPGNIAVTIVPGVPAEPSAGTINFGTYQNEDTVQIDDGQGKVITFQADIGTRPTGSIVFAGQPTDGKILTINDGLNTPITYEFDDNATWNPLRQRVVIGVSAEATRDALIVAINAISAVDGSEVFAAPSGADTILLYNNYIHVNGNQAVTEDDDNITVTGLTGGAAPGANVTEGNILLAVDIDKSDVVDSEKLISDLVDLINDALYFGDTILAEVDGVDAEQINLTHKIPGTDGDQAIVEVGTTFDVVGMAGGVDSTLGIATIANLITAINDQHTLATTAVTADASITNNTVLRNDNYSEDGNIALTSTVAPADITLVGMAGGISPGGKVVAPFIAVPVIGPVGVTPVDEAAAMEALADAINASALDIDAVYDDGVDPLLVTLLNQHGGTAGNEPIIQNEFATTLIVTGMENGTDDGIIDPCFLDLSGNAVPSATGLAAAAALEANGWTVTVEEA